MLGTYSAPLDPEDTPMTDLTAARDIEKTAVRKPTASPGRPIAWRDVVGCLPDDATRSYALSLYRDAGFFPDDIGVIDGARGAAARRRRLARESLADALARTEDWLEYREVDFPRRAHLYRAERDAIRVVRRRLEREI
jgi:hypothetical protein